MAVGDPADRRFTGESTGHETAALSAAAVHEINNPLETLLNLLYLVQAEALTEKGRHYIKLAQQEVSRISLIARQALNQQQMETVPQTVNVAQLFADVLDFYKQKFDSSGIAVETRCSGDANIPVYAGPLRQVFSNLLLNAAEAMPQGGKIQARVSVGHEWSGERRPGVRVSVGDNGSGVAPTVISKIFQPAFTTKARGHGMGLTMVKEVVQKHNGSLRVRSSMQPIRHGTVFRLFLPAA